MKRILVTLGMGILFSSMILGASASHTFVLVHGAWHGEWTFYKLKYELEKAGHTAICVNLPGHGLDTTNPGNVTLLDYQNAIVNVLDTLAEPVVLVGHSMGGIAISMAAEARPEKIDKLVYLAAFMPMDGQSMLDLALQDSLSMIGPSLIFDFQKNIVDVKRENISDIFYDVSTAEYVLLSEMLITPNPLSPLVTPLTLTPENYGSVRRFYITTAYDKAITPAFQEKMYTDQPCEDVYSMNTEHSPFFSAPDNLKNILDKIGDDDKVSKKSVVLDKLSQESKKNEDIIIFNNSQGLVSVDNIKFVEQCSIKIISLDGRLINEYNLDPTSEHFEFRLDNISEKIVIFIIDIDGVYSSQKMFVN